MGKSGSIIIDALPLKVERTYPYRFAFLNDIHVCSQLGLFPENGYTDRWGTKTLPNDGQQYLNEQLALYAKECAENEISHLLCPGDMIIGNNRKESGQYVMKIELDDQADVAAQVIDEFCQKVPTIEKIVMWKGTGYHSAKETSSDYAVALRLKEKGYSVDFRGEFSYLDLKYKTFTKRLWITHTAPNASMYPEQAMGKDMMTYQEAVAQGKLPPVDMIIRAHKHSFVEVHKPSIRALQLPCWQFAVPYDGTLENWGKWQPDIGGVIMMFDEKLRSTVWHFTYPNLIDPSRFVTIENAYKVATMTLKKVT